MSTSFRNLVLKKTIYGESDLIVETLLEDGRIIKCFAHSARKSKRRFSHQFHPAGIYRSTWSKMPEHDRLNPLQASELMEWYPELSEPLERWTRWNLILEWLSFHHESPVEWGELMEMMQQMRSENYIAHFHLFFLRQLRHQGIYPSLDFCEQCHRELYQESTDIREFSFCSRTAKFFHRRCFPSGLKLRPEVFNFLRAGEDQQKNNFSDSFLRAEFLYDLDRISVPYLSVHLDRPLKSQIFFENI